VHEKPASSIPWLVSVYVALMVLLAMTIWAAHESLGAFALLVALVIAGAKAVLVILYFMHVRSASRLTWIFVAAGFLWLSILFGLTFAEYIGRTSLSRAEPLTPSVVP
jgi:cytochrome c oxidase subunit 4